MSKLAKVLVVDDEKHVRQQMKKLLRAIRPEAAIIEAVDGAQGVSLYAAERPDLVLLDTNMPNINGLVALHLLRALDPDAIVVMLTAENAGGVVAATEARGASGYLSKDVPFDQMERKLSKLLGELFGDAAAGTAE